MESTDGSLLYPYQRRWLADKSRFKAGMFSRQSGKTFTCTLEIAKDCVEAEARENRVRWGDSVARRAAGERGHGRGLDPAFKGS